MIAYETDHDVRDLGLLSFVAERRSDKARAHCVLRMACLACCRREETKEVFEAHERRGAPEARVYPQLTRRYPWMGDSTGAYGEAGLYKRAREGCDRNKRRTGQP